MLPTFLALCLVVPSTCLDGNHDDIGMVMGVGMETIIEIDL